MADAATNQLLAQAKCLVCYSETTQMEMQTYIMAAVAGVGMDPNQLAKDAKCFTCLSLDTLLRIKAYLLSKQARIDPTPQALLALTKCYECIPEGMLQSIDTYQILNDIKSPNSDPASVARLSRCFGCLSPQTLLEVQVYLLSLMARVTQNPNVLAQESNVISTIPVTEIRRVVTRTIVESEEGGGGISGCLDVPADLVPVLTGNYTLGILQSLNISFPKVCCSPSGYWIYGASSGAQLQQGTISEDYAGLAVSLVAVDVTGIADADGFYVQQVCADLSESGPSNIVSSYGPQTIPVGSYSYDDMESYADGAALNNLYGGTLWSGKYISNVPYVATTAEDDMTSYTVGAGVNGLNGGTGWQSSYGA